MINLKCLFFLKCLLSVLRRGSLKDLLVRAKVPVEKKKQMGNLVVVRENAAKSALFQKKRRLSLTKRVATHIS